MASRKIWELMEMAEKKTMGEHKFFKACLEVSLDDLEEFFKDEFEHVLSHFITALHADRVVYLRKHCKKCPSAKRADLEVELEPCTKCETEHVSLGNLDSCILTHVTASVLRKLLNYLEQMFQEDWPIVYPAFLEELHAIQTRLEHMRDWIPSAGRDDAENDEREEC